MDFLKKNKFTIIAVIVFLILVLLIAQVTNFLSPGEEKAIYGNRLENKVKISESTKKAIKQNLESDGIVTKSSVRISGRIIDIMATVNSETDKNAAKNLTNKITEKLTKNELKYYDIQLFVKKDTTSDDFPIIGYKHHNKDGFSWTKDR